MTVALTFVLLVTSISMNQNYTISAQETEELFPFRGNKLQNPYLRYGAKDSTIPNWKLSSTNNVFGGESAGTISSKVTDGYRDIGRYNYLVGQKNNTDDSVFKSKSIRVENSSVAENASFMLVGQTIQLQAGYEYYFRAELKSVQGTSNGMLNIYPGTATSGKNGLASERFSATNKLEIVSLPFVADGSGEVTVSLRHFATNDKNTHLEIHRMGFFLKDDDLIQNDSIDALINDKKSSLDAEAKKAKETIDKLENLSQTEKEEAKKLIDKTVNDASKELDKATTPSDIDAIYNQGKTDIGNVVVKAELDDAKTKAIADLNAKAEEVRKQIADKPALSDQQRKDANDEIDQTLAEAIKRIEDTTLIADIPENLKTGMDALDAIEQKYEAKNTENLDKKKDDSKSELDKKAEDAKKEIDKLPNLNDDEKQKAKDDIDQKTKEGKDAIDQLNDPKEIEKVIDTTDKRINDIVEDNKLLDTKNKAKDDLDKKAEDAKKEIDKLPNLSDDEKQKAKDDIDQKTKDGKEAIDQGTTPKDVEDAKNTTDNAVNEIVDQSTLQDAKNKAKKDLEAKADETKKAIDALPGLSQEVKDKAKGEVDNALNKGLENVESGKTIEDLNKVVSETKTEMDAIKDALVKENFESLEKLKDDKKANLNAEAEKAKETIDKLENLSQAEKDQAKKVIDKTVSDASKNIDKASTPSDINSIYNQGKTDIGNVVVKAELDDAKIKAIADLNAKAEEVRKQIADKPALSDQQRKDANAEINKTLAEAIKRIEDTAVITDIPENLKTGIKELEAIEKKYETKNTGNLDKKKEDSKSELDKKAEDAKKEIDELPNLTDDEKQKAKDDIDQKNQDSKDAIDQSNNPKEIEDVIDTTDKGINEIVDDNKLLDSKNEAQKDLDKKAEDAKKEIDKLPNLSDDEKQKAKDDIDQKTEDGKEAIDQGTTPKDVEEAINTTDNAVKEIIDQSTLQDAKNKAKKDLEAKANETKKAIDSLPGISQEAKDKAKEEVDKVLKEGLESINSGSKLDHVKKSLNQSMNQMDKIIKNLAKPQSVLPAAGITASSIRLYGLLISLVGMLIFVIQTKKNRYNH
ncbi:DUF1542 domain-containing protein [Erysipelothrix piscisicarius]|uniref:DUF1542 domain-containing protein n=1 Tax=Erysipelothrix piscisicarius TaxID=2485784 RepID=A0A3Q8S383_9FIRM|nr:DUF1542 domain-containing protein [Erysipelothrix piscisicarius]AZK44751.1 DUF1542 domain-containing protein [Erysipelothrix piscisicarius]